MNTLSLLQNKVLFGLIYLQSFWLDGNRCQRSRHFHKKQRAPSSKGSYAKHNDTKDHHQKWPLTSVWTSFLFRPVMHHTCAATLVLGLRWASPSWQCLKLDDGRWLLHWGWDEEKRRGKKAQGRKEREKEGERAGPGEGASPTFMVAAIDGEERGEWKGKEREKKKKKREKKTSGLVHLVGHKWPI